MLFFGLIYGVQLMVQMLIETVVALVLGLLYLLGLVVRGLVLVGVAAMWLRRKRLERERHHVTR
jgi:hypothetical protein